MASRPDPSIDVDAGESSAETATRRFTGAAALALTAFAAALSIAHLYAVLFADLDERLRNALHFAGFAVLAACFYPMLAARTARARRAILIFDLALGAAAAAAALHLALAETAIYARGVALSTLDWIAAWVAILAAIEFARRVSGWVIPILILLALSYVALWGRWIDGVFSFPGLSLETLTFRSIYNDEGLFGEIARISATFVFPFIIFGAFLVRSGAGEYVIDLARALAGRVAGGPGLVAVFASALTGTISGSAVANTASTGVVTIPLMRQAGFRPTFAAAVEASASTGGQLTPPIMGAGAFVMAAYTGIAYEDIVLAAIAPAALYFLSVGYFVRIAARREGLGALSETSAGAGPNLAEATRARGASFLLPIALVIALLASGLTPSFAAVWGVGAVIASSWLTARPMRLGDVYDALALGARNMIMTAILLCAVGLIVNVIATAGVGATLSLMIERWAGGDLLIAIVLIALASLVLGMGLPVTAAYIVLATLSAPALRDLLVHAQLVDALAAGHVPDQAQAVLMLVAPERAADLAAGLGREAAAELLTLIPPDMLALLRAEMIPAAALTTALLSAHMIIFWLSQDSNVTPPVCLTAFAAAAIAGTRPMATGFTAWKIAKMLYVVPLLFAYTPLLAGDPWAALGIFAFAALGLYALVAAIEGHAEAPVSWPMRGVLAGIGTSLLWPGLGLAPWLGAAALVAFMFWNVRRRPREA